MLMVCRGGVEKIMGPFRGVLQLNATVCCI